MESVVKRVNITFRDGLPLGTHGSFKYDGQSWIAIPLEKYTAIVTVTDRLIGHLNDIRGQLTRWVTARPRGCRADSDDPEHYRPCRRDRARGRCGQDGGAHLVTGWLPFFTLLSQTMLWGMLVPRIASRKVLAILTFTRLPEDPGF